jgi:hypothetical protein
MSNTSRLIASQGVSLPAGDKGHHKKQKRKQSVKIIVGTNFISFMMLIGFPLQEIALCPNGQNDQFIIRTAFDKPSLPKETGVWEHLL